MPRFAANISLMFTEVPFLERIKNAASAGFKAVECQFPYHVEAIDMADACAVAGVKLALINAPPGDWEAGERGLAALPDRVQDFRDSIEVALAYADTAESPRIHVMAGVIDPEADGALETYEKNIAYAADKAREEGIEVVIENVVMPGYFLTFPDQAADVIRRLDKKNLKMLFDAFHAQRAQGNLADFLEQNLDIIGHIQIAGVPGRHEPDKFNEVNWRFIFDFLDAQGYDGWVGCEYNPRGGTLRGLTWGKEWGLGSKD
ncbi:MAG: hydroxypyruvate isomerase family protein [Rhodospirillaceae bacterium]